MLNRKISVLIVDDEKYIREGLQALLEWETMGFSVCDEAGTGEEALEKIFLYQPDLVLMDIKMPGMSGIDVIKTVREKDYAGEIIVLSGYSDFQYAQSAMHYGVEEYIVKPVEEKILLGAVLRAKEKISRVQDRENFMQQYLKKAKSMVLHDLLTGKEFDPYMDYGELKLNASVYQVIICENRIPQLQLSHFGDLLLLGDSEDEYIEQLKIQNRDVILLKHRLALERFQRWLSHYDGEYQKKSFMDLVFCVYGEAVTDLSKISLSYMECLALMERKFFCDEDQRVLSWQELPKKTEAVKPESDRSRYYSERFAGYIQTHNRNRIEQLLEELKNYLSKNNFQVQTVRHFLIDVFLEMKHLIILSYGSSKEIPFQKNAVIIELIERKKYLYEIFDYFREQYEMIMSYVGIEKTDNIFDQILDYVQNNYASQLKLEGLSQIFGYSSSYLGRLFTQKCDCSFKTYLDQIRVVQAEKLLLETDLKVYEIASIVGYRHVDVFHQKFRKVFQMSPAEYRKEKKERDFGNA